MEEFEIAGTRIALGEEKTTSVNLARLYDFTELTMPVRVIRGKIDGPKLFVSGAIHGDELVGTEIIKRIICSKRAKKLKGTLIAVPIVNVFGYNTGSRYLPDRRDLNRSFPGSKDGSLAARMAHLFLEEIMSKVDYGIDLHSGSIHRENLPQIRANIVDEETKRLAEVFNAPVVLNSKLRDGSLREAADEMGVKMLLFEGGEGLRIDEKVIKVGIRGIFSVMEEIGMLEKIPAKEPRLNPFIAKSSYWVRASQSGSHRSVRKLGAFVEKDSKLGEITDSFGRNKMSVSAAKKGVIIGQNNLPLVNKGDALFHIATFEDTDEFNQILDEYERYIDGIDL